MKTKPGQSDRGFLKYDPVTSCHQMPCGIELKESSIAGEGAHLWLFIRGECREHLGKHTQPTPHLSVNSVKVLIGQLQDWVKRVEAGATLEPADHE